MKAILQNRSLLKNYDLYDKMSFLVFSLECQNLFKATSLFQKLQITRKQLHLSKYITLCAWLIMSKSIQNREETFTKNKFWFNDYFSFPTFLYNLSTVTFIEKCYSICFIVNNKFSWNPWRNIQKSRNLDFRATSLFQKLKINRKRWLLLKYVTHCE